MKNLITFLVVLLLVYVVVTHGTAWAGVAKTTSVHLANFVTTKPIATVQTTSSAWSNVL